MEKILSKAEKGLIAKIFAFVLISFVLAFLGIFLYVTVFSFFMLWNLFLLGLYAIVASFGLGYLFSYQVAFKEKSKSFKVSACIISASISIVAMIISTPIINFVFFYHQSWYKF